MKWLRQVVTEMLSIVKDFCGVTMWKEKRASITRVRRTIVVVPWDAKAADLVQKGTQTKGNFAGTVKSEIVRRLERGAGQ